MIDDSHLTECYKKLDRILISLFVQLQGESRPFSFEQLSSLAQRGKMSFGTAQSVFRKLNVSAGLEELREASIEVLMEHKTVCENEIKRIKMELEINRKRDLCMLIDANIKDDFTKFFDNTGIEI